MEIALLSVFHQNKSKTSKHFVTLMSPKRINLCKIIKYAQKLYEYLFIFIKCVYRNFIRFVVLYIHTTTNITNKNFFHFPSFFDKRKQQKDTVIIGVFLFYKNTPLFFAKNAFKQRCIKYSCRILSARGQADYLCKIGERGL